MSLFFSSLIKTESTIFYIVPAMVLKTSVLSTLILGTSVILHLWTFVFFGIPFKNLNSMNMVYAPVHFYSIIF